MRNLRFTPARVGLIPSALLLLSSVLVTPFALRAQSTYQALYAPRDERPAPKPTRSAHWLSASVAYDFRDQDDQSVDVGRTFSDFLISGVRAPADSIALVSLGLRSSTSEPSITSFEDSMTYLRAQAPALDLAQRQQALSVIGAVLRQGYSPSITPNQNMESLFQNARRRGPSGGVCGDIHTYLARAATELGFDAAGTHTGVWKDYLGTRWGGWHVVSHFRDPATGEYYMQNYEEVFATGQKTLPNLVEVSTRILGFAWKSSINSLPGVAHAYIPRFSRWMWDGIEAQIASPLDQHLFTATLSNRSQSLGAHYGWSDAHQQLKFFALASRFDADEGDYEFATAGAAYTVNAAKKFSDTWLDEAGLRATGYVGGIWFDAPIFRTGADTTTLRAVQWGTSSYMYGFSARGHLRRGGTTASLDAQIMAATSQDSREEFRLGVAHAFKSLPLTLRFDRAYDLVYLEQSWTHLDVAYDRLGAELRLRVTDAIALRLKADGFALGGLDNCGGTAARAGADVSFQTRRLGTFTLGADWGEVLENTDNDPFYDLPASRYATLGWSRPVGRTSTVGIGLSYGKGPPTQPFGTFGAHTPELNDGTRQLSALVSLNITF